MAGPIRVAAVGDVHVNETTSAEWRALLDQICAEADILVLPGDLTNRGLPREAGVLVDGLGRCKLPVVAILGNHDYESGQQEEVKQILCDSGVVLLDEEPHEVLGIGFAGEKGFCGGFDQHALAPFGEAPVKEFVREAVDGALRLESGLSRLRTERKLAVLHYAPIRQTVEGEPPEIFPFLGSSRLAEPIDRFGVTAVVHGHAHHGSPRGMTSGGTPVYNVSFPLMQTVDAARPYLLLEL